MFLWTALVACVFVQETVYVDSGSTDTGFGFETHDDGGMCTSDDQCSGPYACNHGTTSYTDDRGCIERCSTDWDCKAGSTCEDDGACR